MRTPQTHGPGVEHSDHMIGRGIFGDHNNPHPVHDDLGGEGIYSVHHVAYVGIFDERHAVNLGGEGI